MGLLIDGEWKDKWYETDESGGEFRRPETHFRDWVGKTLDDNGDIKFPAARGRYHLYVAEACPWAHRTLLFRHLKGLSDFISVSMVHPRMPHDTGWVFGDAPYADDVNAQDRLAGVYLAADKTFTGRVTVPVLWDKERKTIVNNESADIIRILNRAFDDVGATGPDYCPSSLKDEIETVNERVYNDVNNGVYKCGFATSQDAYERAFGKLFETLDWLDDRLATQRYLVSDAITEADWRLFTTLVRFDAVYFGHFKCNRQRISDFHHLSGYLRELYQVPGVKDTTRIAAIKDHYYWSHTSINPYRIVPVGPALDLDKPHHREKIER